MRYMQWFVNFIIKIAPRKLYPVYVVPTDSPHTTTYACVETRYTNRGGEVSELRVNVTVIVEGKLIIVLLLHVIRPYTNYYFRALSSFTKTKTW